MDQNIIFIFVFLYILLIPMAEGAVPGTFFWKPRLGLDLTVATEKGQVAHKPSADNINNGYVVLIDGYTAGLTVIALVVSITAYKNHASLDPRSAYYYTNFYRWALRHFSLYPYWLAGSGGHYVDTHKVWRRRFYYMEEFVPQWLRRILYFVDKSEWEKEEKEFVKFKLYAEPAFGKHYHYPRKTTVDYNWNSEITGETIENMDSSSVSFNVALP